MSDLELSELTIKVSKAAFVPLKDYSSEIKKLFTLQISVQTKKEK